MEDWEDLYEKKLSDLKAHLHAMLKRSRNIRRDIHDDEIKLNELKDKLSTFSMLDVLKNATHLIRTKDYYIIDMADYEDSVIAIGLKYNIGIISIDNSIIPCISEDDAKIKLTEYIYDQIDNGNIYEKYSLQTALSAIKDYGLKIDDTRLNYLKQYILNERIKQLVDLKADYIEKISYIKKIAIDRLDKLGLSSIDDDSITMFFNHIDVLISNIDKPIPTD